MLATSTTLKQVLAVAAVGLVVACNAILDIPEGHLRDDGTTGTSSGTSNGSTSSGDDDDIEPNPCPSGQKQCGDRCVGRDQPATGCGNDSCDPCNATNGTAACQDGKCIVATCNDGFLDCNDDPSDLCEKDITNDRENCGFCKQACPGTMRCEQATCKCKGDADPQQECGGPDWTCHNQTGRCRCGGNECDIGEGCDDDNNCVGPQ